VDKRINTALIASKLGCRHVEFAKERELRESLDYRKPFNLAASTVDKMGDLRWIVRPLGNRAFGMTHTDFIGQWG
jgi:hypothetical protein